MGLPDVRSYYLKRDDLLVLRAGVALQFDLLRRGIDADAIGPAIREAGLDPPLHGRDARLEPHEANAELPGAARTQGPAARIRIVIAG